MARRPRIDIEDGRHHVFNRGANRQAIFLDDGVDEELLSDKTMANFNEDHSSLYHDFPPFAG